MTILGAHVSIAGGFDKAVSRAAEVGCNCVQIFVSNPRQFPKIQAASAPIVGKGAGQPTMSQTAAIDDRHAEQFHAALAAEGIQHPIAHASYLINLASPDDAARQRSVDGFVEELRRSEALGLEGLVLHPGAHLKSSVEAGIERVAESLNEAHRRTPDYRVQCYLETTAGQGTNLGHRFEQLAAILELVDESDRIGICLDTCHVFAAGYGMIERRDYLATMRSFDKLLGASRIRAFHLNDSQREQGSRVDRHENIGRGEMGLEPFRHLLNDRRFRNVPMYIETPKGNRRGKPWDQVNLELLRSLVKTRKRS